MLPPKLYKKKECIRLSWFSILLILLMLFLFFRVIGSSLYNFLSPIKETTTKILVVEGWIDDFSIEQAYKIFQEGDYELIITTGGPLEIGYLATRFVTAAELGKTTFLILGMDSTKIVSVASKRVLTERTFHSALTLKEWFLEYRPDIKSFNLISLGPHSRRSWYLFQKAMPDKEIGVIALGDQRFDPQKWWKSSKGTRTVLAETIGIFYVFFFM